MTLADLNGTYTSILDLYKNDMEDDFEAYMGELNNNADKIESNLAESRIVEHNLDVADPSNGYYVRWENGLQICWFDNLEGSYEGDNRLEGNWSFPANFLDDKIFAAIDNSLSLSIINKLSGKTMFYLRNYSNSSVQARLYDNSHPFSSDDSYIVKAIAIGRWK